MKEIPEYQRNAKIQSTGKASFMGSVPVKRTHKTDTQIYAAISNFGANLAQKSANKRAELSAIEAAQNPGQTTLFPEITEADRHFNETYKQEELQVVSAQANSYLQNIYQQADRVQNPSMGTVNAFQKNALQANQKFLSQLTPENRPKLERALKSAYEANYSQLVLKLEKHNRQVMNAQSNKALDQSARDLQNYRLMGNDDAAQSAYERGQQIIQSREARGDDLPDMAEKKRRALYEANQIAHYQKRTEDAIKEGKGEEFIKNLRENPPDHLDFQTREAVIAGSMQYANQYNAALSGQQSIEYLGYQKAMAEGTLTPTMMAEAVERMGPTNAAKMELQIAKANVEQNQLNLLTQKMVGEFSSPDKMSQYSDKDINKVYQKLIGQAEQIRGYDPGTMPLIEQAQLAQEIKAPVSDLSNKISARLTGGDAASAAEAAQVVKVLDINNPLVLSGLDKQTKLMANGIANAVSVGEDPEIAVEKRRKNILGLTASGVEDREKQFDYLTKGRKAGSKDFNDPNKEAKFVSDNMGISKSNLPVGVATEFTKMLKDNYVACGDWNDALEETTKTFNRTYRESNVNGYWQTMFGAPEIYYPPGIDGNKEIRGQALNNFKDVAKSTKELYDQQGINFYYEIQKQEPVKLEKTGEYPSTETDIPFDVSEIENRESMKVKRVWRSGKTDEGHLEIQSDRKTTIPEGGKMPSYWLGIRFNDQNPEGVINPQTSQPVRFQPNLDNLIDIHNKGVKEKQQEVMEKGRGEEIERRKRHKDRKEINPESFNNFNPELIAP